MRHGRPHAGRSRTHTCVSDENRPTSSFATLRFSSFTAMCIAVISSPANLTGMSTKPGQARKTSIAWSSCSFEVAVSA